MREPGTDELQLRIPFGTMVKVALFLLLAFAVMKLSAFVAIVYVAAMLAVVMAAVTDWLEKRVPAIAPYIKDLVTELSSRPAPGNVKRWLSTGATAGRSCR